MRIRLHDDEKGVQLLYSRENEPYVRFDFSIMDDHYRDDLSPDDPKQGGRVEISGARIWPGRRDDGDKTEGWMLMPQTNGRVKNFWPVKLNAPIRSALRARIQRHPLYIQALAEAAAMELPTFGVRRQGGRR